ncbi:MAG: Uma2 family endonuclease [Burkholderiales bacterium]
MSTVTDLVTADDLLQRRDDGYRYELVRGELKRMAPAGGPHGQVANRVNWRLTSHVEADRLGVVFAAETGFRIAAKPDTVRAPDVAFISRARIEKIGVPEGYWPGAPDLAIEVISPGDTFSEVEEKVLDWLAAGCRMVIVVDPRKHTASVYRGPNARLLTADDTLSGEDVVPGWSVLVRDLFE